MLGQCSYLPWLNQHSAEDKVACQREQGSTSGESQTSYPLTSSLTFYHWATALLYTHADVSSGNVGLIIGLRIHLHPYFVYMNTTVKAPASLHVCTGSPETVAQ